MKRILLMQYYRLLGKLAKIYIKKHKPYIIGINGSVGKTSCRMIVAQTLHKFLPNKKIVTSSKNFNGELGMSLSIFEQETWTPTLSTFFLTLFLSIKKILFDKKPYDIIVLEYGIDHPGEMDFLLSIVKPDIGIFTAVDSVHSEQFGDPSVIANEESKMVKNTKELIFLNANDGYVASLGSHIKQDILMYQTEGYEKTTDISFDQEKFIIRDVVGNIGVQVQLKIRNTTYKVTTNVVGKAHYGYIGVALSIAEILQYKYGITKGIAPEIKIDYHLQPGRLSIFPGIEQSVIVDSTYNASPLSIRNVINTVQVMKQQLFPQRKIWILLGDMRELGDLTEKEHRLLAGYISQVADRVFLVGEKMIGYLADELEKVGYPITQMYKFMKSTEAGEIIKRMLKEPGYEMIIVGKGSQNTIFLEEAIKKLLKDPSDQKYLTRQSDWWLKKKKKFFGL